MAGVEFRGEAVGASDRHSSGDAVETASSLSAAGWSGEALQESRLSRFSDQQSKFGSVGKIDVPDVEILDQLQLAQQHLDAAASSQSFDYDLPGGSQSHIQLKDGEIESALISRPDGSTRQIEYQNGKPRSVREQAAGDVTIRQYDDNGSLDSKHTARSDGTSQDVRYFNGRKWIVRDTEASGDFTQCKFDDNGTLVSRDVEKTLGQGGRGERIFSHQFTAAGVDQMIVYQGPKVLGKFDLLAGKESERAAER